MQWVWLQTERAALIFARADEAVVPETPATLVYLYTDNVADADG